MKFFHFFFPLFLMAFSAVTYAQNLSCRIKRDLPGMNYDHFFEFRFNQSAGRGQTWKYETSFAEFEISAITHKKPGEDPLFPYGYSIISISGHEADHWATVYQGQLNYLSTSHGSFVLTDSQGNKHFISFDCFYFR